MSIRKVSHIFCTRLVIAGCAAATVMITLWFFFGSRLHVDRTEVTAFPCFIEVHSSEIQTRSTSNNIKLVNSGTTVVVIDGIESSCGCTVISDIPRNKIQPNDTAQFTIRMFGPSHGSQAATVRVRYHSSSNVYDSIVIPITMHGRPLECPHVILSPSNIELRGYEPADFRREIVIQSRECGGVPWITGVRCDSDEVSAKVIDSHVAQTGTSGEVLREYRLEVVSKRPTSPGHRAFATAYLETASEPKRPTTPIRISCEWSRIVRVFPESVVIRGVSGSPMQHVREINCLWLNANNPPQWESLLIDQLPDGVSAVIVNGANSSRRIVRVTVEPNIKSDCVVSLRYDGERIPIKVSVR